MRNINCLRVKWYFLDSHIQKYENWHRYNKKKIFLIKKKNKAVLAKIDIKYTCVCDNVHCRLLFSVVCYPVYSGRFIRQASSLLLSENVYLEATPKLHATADILSTCILHLL